MNVKPRKVEVVSKIFQDFKDRKGKTQLIAKVVAVMVILFAIAFLVASCSPLSLLGIPKAYAENVTVVECKYFASKGNNTEYSPSFTVPVDMEKGFLYHLENGFEKAQKKIMFDNAKKFFRGKEIKNYKAAGMVCTDPNGPGKVSIIMEK
jgi:hypothetical protein